LIYTRLSIAVETSSGVDLIIISYGGSMEWDGLGGIDEIHGYEYE
jgi:hypothetical protein